MNSTTTTKKKTVKKKTIYEKLLLAQRDFKPAKKGADNPFFNSSYSTLSEVWDSCRDALHKQGLFVANEIEMVEGLDNQVTLVTKVYDRSGESVSSRIPIVTKDPTDPQKLGSSITYARRYNLSALLNLMSEEDDDGNRGSSPKVTKSPAESNMGASRPKYGGSMTQKQKSLIVKLYKDKSLNKDAMANLMKLKFKVDAYSELSSEQASAWIQTLMNMDGKAE